VGVSPEGVATVWGVQELNVHPVSGKYSVDARLPVCLLKSIINSAGLMRGRRVPGKGSREACLTFFTIAVSGVPSSAVGVLRGLIDLRAAAVPFLLQSMLLVMLI
jgi:hypothetical protein